DVNEFNGPLMFIPGSHRLGVLDAEHDTSTTSYPLWAINHDTIRKLVDRGGLGAPKGPAGPMIVVHRRLVHASTANLVPWANASEAAYTIQCTRRPWPLSSLIVVNVTKPAPIPFVIDHVNGMTSIVTKAGIASS